MVVSNASRGFRYVVHVGFQQPGGSSGEMIMSGIYMVLPDDIDELKISSW
jgi:hypothetical protein